MQSSGLWTPWCVTDALHMHSRARARARINETVSVAPGVGGSGGPEARTLLKDFTGCHYAGIERWSTRVVKCLDVVRFKCIVRAVERKKWLRALIVRVRLE